MKRKNIKESIKEYFFQYPTLRLRVREAERELHLSLPSIIRYFKELEKENILKKEKIITALKSAWKLFIGNWLISLEMAFILFIVYLSAAYLTAFIFALFLSKSSPIVSSPFFMNA